MWNKLKSAIFVEEPQPSSPPPATAPVNNISGVITSGDKNQNFTENIRVSTLSRISPFVDLIHASEKLSGIITDPVLCLKAAFATLSNGQTVAQITDAIGIHLADIDSEEIRFKQFLSEKYESVIAEDLTFIDGLENQIKSNIVEAARLQKIIDDLLYNKNAELGLTVKETEASVQNKRTELNEMSVQFKLSADAVRNALNTQKTAILSIFSKEIK